MESKKDQLKESTSIKYGSNNNGDGNTTENFNKIDGLNVASIIACLLWPTNKLKQIFLTFERRNLLVIIVFIDTFAESMLTGVVGKAFYFIRLSKPYLAYTVLGNFL